MHCAANRDAILLILQAMDAAGRDGAIWHVLSGVNPQGCQIFSYHNPPIADSHHDFLWRTTCDLPERGRKGIFYGPYYQEPLKLAGSHRPKLRKFVMIIVIATSNSFNATPEQVWNILSDFSPRGEGSNFSTVGGVPNIGSRLSMNMPGMLFASPVTAATPGKTLEWAASLFRESVLCCRHWFVLTPNPDGTADVSNVETFLGALVWAFQGLFTQNKKRRANGYDGFNQALKWRVERWLGR